MSFITDRYYQMLENHRIYERVSSQRALAFFMERHVICVWIYHSLLQSLYQELVDGLQTINSDDKKECVRLITEIILDEVVEDLGDGQFQSHLELYIEAMEDIGANVSPILSFFDMVDKGFSVKRSLELANFPKESLKYAKRMIPLINEPAYKKATALFYEGEPFIPDNFLVAVESLLPKVPVNLLLDYFESHIEGLKRPGFSASGRLAEILCSVDNRYHANAEKVAERVMKSRLELWNAISLSLEDGDLCETPALTLLHGGKTPALPLVT